MTRTMVTWIGAVLIVGALAPTGIAAGSSPPTCFGEPATIVRGDADDDIVGTSGRDVIVSGGGQDYIQARGGPDLVCAGWGEDWIGLGRGADRARAGDGNDAINGGPGFDRARGGDGSDNCYLVERVSSCIRVAPDG